MKTFKDPSRKLAACADRARRLEERWQALCDRHLPLAPEDSVWRYHHAANPEAPTQGWKLHLSATLLNACDVLERVAPFLAARSIPYKAPRSLQELIKINSGLYYGYSQVGKIITVYPPTTEEAVRLARELRRLTGRVSAPAVPFDRRFGGNVYYRFGAFAHMEVEHADGRRAPAIRDPDGRLVPDARYAEDARPEWVSDPFTAARPRGPRPRAAGPDASSFRVFRALVQRGKGGVYQAVDLRGDAPRLCLLKEGRRDGELGWDGRDGARRVRHEERVISSLLAAGVDAPRIYSSFYLSGNYYLVTEFIEGESLHSLLARRERRMPVPVALRYGLRLSEIFRGLHAAGWVWRDCKPANILVTPEGRLRPIDFEGACPARRPDPLYWGTPGFTPPEWRERDFSPRASTSGDVYALGSVLYLLLTGRVPEASEPAPVESLRGDVPAAVRALVTRLLDRDPDSRPRAEEVVRELEAALSSPDRVRPAVGRSSREPVSAAAATGG
ncbi:MAG TPA: protein kinase [Pyrinomonadaceae bacterium]|jgi:hypothetical protein|nr:protein kinase [Pyrinomonadaceae bacterium]